MPDSEPRRSFAAGDKVTRAGYDGVVIGEYLPGMYEVRLASGDVVAPAEELTPRDEAGRTSTAGNRRQPRSDPAGPC